MTRFEQILRKMGEDITWHKRQEGAIDSETGDRVVTWTTEAIKAIVQQVSIGEVFVEAGYTDEDYIRIYVTANVKHKDKVTCRNEDYEVLVPEAFHFRGAFEYRTVLCRRLIA